MKKMKLPFMLALLAGSVVASAGAQVDAQELILVPEESKISFVGTKPEGKHEGGFKKFDVKAIANFEEPSRSSINIQIEASSLWADDQKLANHLKSPDFFNVRKYPAITFESIEIVPGEKEGEVPTATIKGDLHMLGEKVAVDVPIQAKVTEETVEMTAEFKIDRTKWGMDYGQGKVDNQVQVKVKFVMNR